MKSLSSVIAIGYETPRSVETMGTKPLWAAQTLAYLVSSNSIRAFGFRRRTRNAGLALVALEILHVALMLLGGGSGLEGTYIASPAGPRVRLS
jgi:hypothetical protein